MKKNKIYLLFVVFIIGAAGAILYAYNKKQTALEVKKYEVLARKGDAANSVEWKTVAEKAKMYQDLLNETPEDSKTALKLAALFIEEARVTGNHNYYDQAALRYIDDVLQKEPDNFNALVFKSLIFMSQHHFAEGLATAQKAQTINPSNAYVYGLLVDGNVEMGNYEQAIANADKMVAIRPDLTSYSRISYVREINGDYAGAIKAMTMAVESGGAGDEHTEWTRTQLAHLYEKTGDFVHADSLYRFSLQLRPAYPYAIAGLGRVALAKNDHKEAINKYQHAISLVEDYSLKAELADIYKIAGMNDESDNILNKIIADMNEEAKNSPGGESSNHHNDQELAIAYLKLGNLDKALTHALTEYNRRPLNIDVNETLGWIYYNRKEYAKALPHIKTALKTNSRNPILLSRASLIFYKTGETELAKSILIHVKKGNQYIGKQLQAETAAVFQLM